MRPPDPAGCCAEYAHLTRDGLSRGVSRRGLFAGGLAAGTAVVLGSAVVTAAPASAAAADAVLVVLSLRGAADGLSLVVPHSDPIYYAARPGIAIPAASLLARDATFGLHPSLAPLLPMWNAHEVAAVHAAGLPAPNRSHFAAMEEIEDASPGSAKREGWLNRLVGAIPGSSPLQGFALGGGVIPTSLLGNQPVMSGSTVGSVGFAGDDQWDDGSRLTSLHSMWDGADGALGGAMRSAFDSVADFAPARRTQDNIATYPGTDLGRALSEAARMIRGDVGVGVVTVDQGDWDMHSGLGTLEWGRMRDNAAELAGALVAFFDDLGAQRSKVTLVAFSEFGRRVKENNYGLDHGHGNVMLVAGAGVRGGYHGTLPPLSGDEDADVPVTTDYRSVLAEIVTTRLHASSATVFPGFTPTTVGVMNSL